MPARILLMAVCLASALSAAEARGDGGTIRLRESHGSYQVTVFTSPVPLRAGTIDVSVLVQDKTGSVVDEGINLEVVAQRCDSRGVTYRRRATKEAATNKLLKAAQFQLPQPGCWRIDVLLHAPEEPEIRPTFMAEVSPAIPRWVTFWPWFSWPIIVIALFGTHQWLTRRHATGIS